MRVLPWLITVLALAATGPAFAECTAQQADAKAGELARKVAAATSHGPQRARQINEELQGMKVQRTTRGAANECALYEKRPREIDEAEHRAKTE
jgi:hypothetical protein